MPNTQNIVANFLVDAAEIFAIAQWLDRALCVAEMQAHIDDGKACAAIGEILIIGRWVLVSAPSA